MNASSTPSLYNDFLSERGELWPWVREIAEHNRLLDNLRDIVRAARDVGGGIYHVPHHCWEPGDYVNRKYPRLTSSLLVNGRLLLRAAGVARLRRRFPGQLGDIVSTEHRASSGFPNSDLDH
jgi:hypothetical protein